jgi:hypothetical protein
VKPAILGSLIILAAGAITADDRLWENPVFESWQQAVAAATSAAPALDAESSRAERLFVEMTLAAGDPGRDPSAQPTMRDVVGNLLITHPVGFVDSPVQRTTVDRFSRAVPRQQAVLRERLARFGYPELPGMVYCRLVESVDAFADLNAASSDKMSQVGGVTYYCRYVVLPLSYVGETAIRELRRSAALNPGVNVETTIRQWQAESYANLINTFRHELVHVHTNAALGVPRYSNRSLYPTWFHEGTATYLAADPHAGLSEGYKEYQDVFFYLVQRHGVRRLQEFYAGVLGGDSVATVLGKVYGISDSDRLFTRSARWHGLKDRVKTVLWIVALGVVGLAIRGTDRPAIGYLLLLASAVIGLGVATGLAEHIYGLRGPTIVWIAKIGFLALAAFLAALGVRRIHRYRLRSRVRTESG